MKKKIIDDKDEMLPEYDFSGGIRGKYATRFAEQNGYIKIDPIVSKYFTNPEDINKILIAIVNSISRKSHPA